MPNIVDPVVAVDQSGREIHASEYYANPDAFAVQPVVAVGHVVAQAARKVKNAPKLAGSPKRWGGPPKKFGPKAPPAGVGKAPGLMRRIGNKVTKNLNAQRQFIRKTASIPPKQVKQFVRAANS